MLSFTEVKAQNSGAYNLTTYDYRDSTLIPERKMAQYDDWANGRALFPAKPKNQWEIGLSLGGLNVSGDIRSKSILNGAIKPMNTLGFGVHIRKALGHVFSTKLEYIHGNASGYNYQSAIGYNIPGNRHGNNPWVANGYNSRVYYNYCTAIRNLSLDFVAALNNTRYYQNNGKWSMHVLGGIGGLLYSSKTDALDANGASYATTMATIDGQNYNPHIFEDRKKINTDLKAMFDGNYETASERHNNRGWYGTDYTFRPIMNAGIGVQYRVAKNISLQLEDKVIFTMDDLVDGQRWQERDAMTRDMDNINYLSLGLNFHLGKNSVAPLWWVNPNDFLYNAAANASIPDNKCNNDADGDGVSDCYDRCGDTPGGVAVDTHGCPLDTDGDGVADYKDKELITPTSCQPSNADGIGNCPCNPNCPTGVAPPGCNLGNGSINFSGGSRTLSSGAQNQLNNLANAMRSNPNCSVVVMGYGANSKVEQQRSWDRVNAVINFMVDRNGIDRSRFIFQYGLPGNADAVDYRAAGDGDTGPSNTPPPFPNLRRN